MPSDTAIAMIALRFAIVPSLTLFLATAVCFQASAQQAPRHPMIFFLAKGGPDACGPGCAEWIAAQGTFGPDTLGRLNAFLHALNRSDLPVFFHSPGGSGHAAISVGYKLRGWRIAAGVGRTVVQGCNDKGAPDETCLALMQSEQQLGAELRFDGTICASACVFALIGAPTRHVSEQARLGIHASRFAREPQWGIDTTALEQAARMRSTDTTRHYLVTMGVDGSLIDEAEKTPHNRIHWLSRDEMRQFGILATGVFETSWALVDRLVIKSLTRAAPRTTVLKIKCHTDERAQIVIRRELPDEELGILSAVTLASGGKIVAQSAGSNDARDDERILIVPRSVLRDVASNGLLLEESLGTEQGGTVRTTPIAMAGFADAVDKMLSRCGAARPQPAIPAPRRLRFARMRGS